MAVVPLHTALAGPTIETGVAFTVIDSRVTGFPCDQGTKTISRSEESGQ